MINKKVTGIGCFAKPSTLSRVFKKMVQNYTLGQFECINLVNGHDEVRGADSTVLLKALIAGKTGYFPLPDSESCACRGKQKNYRLFSNTEESETEFVDLCEGRPQHPGEIHGQFGCVYGIKAETAELIAPIKRGAELN